MSEVASALCHVVLCRVVCVAAVLCFAVLRYAGLCCVLLSCSEHFCAVRSLGCVVVCCILFAPIAMSCVFVVFVLCALKSWYYISLPCIVVVVVVVTCLLLAVGHADTDCCLASSLHLNPSSFVMSPGGLCHRTPESRAWLG